MKDSKINFTVDDKEYTMIFNLNVMQLIQEEYGTVKKWGELTDGKASECNIKALIFGIKAMLNEAIDIENEELNINNPFLNEKEVGRLISKMGLDFAHAKMLKTVTDATESNNQKNE